MVFCKLLILIIALGYVSSLPVNNVEKSLPLPSEIKPEKLESLKSTEVPEQKLSRVVRDNKVEYIYIKDGEVVPKHHFRSLIEEPASEQLTSSKENKLKRTLEFVESPLKSKEEQSYPADPTHYSSGGYASGGIKVRTDTKTRVNGLTNAVNSDLSPQQQIPQVASTNLLTPPLLPAPLLPAPLLASSLFTSPIEQKTPIGQSIHSFDANLLSSYLNNPNQLNSPYSSFPLSYQSILQNAYNPYYSLDNSIYGQSLLALLQGGLFNRAANLALDNLEIRRSLYPQSGLDSLQALLSSSPYLFQNRLMSPNSIGNHLLGRSLNSLIFLTNLLQSTPYTNPLLSYAVPQQTPNLNYLMRAGIGNLGLSGLNDNLLYPGINSNLIHANSINNLLYPGLLNYNQQMMVPGNLNANNFLLNEKLAVPTITTETPPNSATTNVLPFTDSIANVKTSALNPSSSSVVSQIAESNALNYDKPPSFYSNSNQNAALRTSLDPGYSYLNAYSNRLIDPFSSYYRYAPSYLNNRYPYPAFAYSPAAAYYRPGLAGLATIPSIGYNGIGFYSAALPESSVLSRKSETNDSKKPLVEKEPETGKDGLMYSIKTLKTESKETVSRLNQSQDANKIIISENKNA